MSEDREKEKTFERSPGSWSGLPWQMWCEGPCEERKIGEGGRG